MTADSDSQDSIKRGTYLADARRLSIRDLLDTQKSTQSAISADESTKWRELIHAAKDDLLTQLWERYNTDCQLRGISETYLDFIPKAARLTHPLLPEYWDLYVNDCLERDVIPDPFLTFAHRMQAALQTQPDNPSKGHSR